MSEWEDKLNALLSNPDSMAKVMQLAQSFSQSTDNTNPSANTNPPADNVVNETLTPVSSNTDTLSVLSNVVKGVDPSLLKRVLPMIQQLNRGTSSESTALLQALRPFLRENRRDKIDRALQLAKILHMAKIFLTTHDEA